MSTKTKYSLSSFDAVNLKMWQPTLSQSLSSLKYINWSIRCDNDSLNKGFYACCKYNGCTFILIYTYIYIIWPEDCVQTLGCRHLVLISVYTFLKYIIKIKFSCHCTFQLFHIIDDIICLLLALLWTADKKVTY